MFSSPALIEIEQSNYLQSRLRQSIQQFGPMTFAAYMERVLFEPELGYYTGPPVKFGKEGDFTTGPELSTLYSQCLAYQCVEILSNLTGGSILELGAGTGKMSAVILQTLDTQGIFPTNYFILEVSPNLRHRQELFLKTTLSSALYSRVVWVDRLPDVFIGIVLANEVLDALPVHRFQITEKKIQEYYVTYKNDAFSWELGPTSSTVLEETIQALSITPSQLDQTYISEICLQINKLLKDLNDMLKQGVVLFIDYGFPRAEYYHPDRNQGTLMCYYKHFAHADPFFWPGLQDITAHVDFTWVAQIAQREQFSIAGFTQQAAFLLDCGLIKMMEKPTREIKEHYTLAQEVKRLTLPTQMGELYKVLALTRNYTDNLLGFKSYNRLTRLCLNI